MNIFIYSDESGVLDPKHNDFFVFGGIVFLSKDDRDVCSRKYIHAENTIRNIEHKDSSYEVKASNITNKSKNKLYRSLNQVEKFAVIINQKKLHSTLFDNKKSKQRYLDWAFKMAIKDKFVELISRGLINAKDVENLYFFVDEHTTATNGIYELREALEQEFKYGTYNFDWMHYYPPIFPNLKQVNVTFSNSEKTTLVRAADIVANHVFYLSNNFDLPLQQKNNLHIMYHPKIK